MPFQVSLGIYKKWLNTNMDLLVREQPPRVLDKLFNFLKLTLEKLNNKYYNVIKAISNL